MNFTEGLLVLIIIILTVVIFSQYYNGATSTPAPPTAPALPPAPTAPVTSPESFSTLQNTEYFSVCGDSTDVTKDMSCYCGDSTGQFANDAFGGPGLDYHDYIMAQGVDAQVVKNQAQFIADRTQNSSVNTTGPTYAMPDWEDGTTANGWIGLRRPQNVPVCNPTQVTDYNEGGYTDKPTFTWDSSQTGL